ncbi:G2/mitotic-specific cyclin [Coemansia sp. S3946]|nr:G2/mitotic-specific cyclin [Coemansia sp. S3946]
MTVDSQATIVKLACAYSPLCTLAGKYAKATPIASSISVPCTQELDIELYGIDIVSGWNDIDANDSNDPLQASEYVDNTIEYLCERELVTMPNHAYMDRQKDLTWRMRHELVDWMVQIHYQLCLLPEALFLVRMALFRMCLIEDKHRPRSEAAMSTTMLLTSTAFRHMDKGDVMDTISRLVVEYYGK